jgi:alpha-glucosidase
LPQPKWFSDYSVESEDGVKNSPLEIYRSAMKLRKSLIAEESITWHETTDKEVLHFSRPNGWNCMINFNGANYPMPEGEVLISSAPSAEKSVPAGTTVWFKN